MILSTRLKTYKTFLRAQFWLQANVVGLYPGILHKGGLNVLREALNNRENKHIPTDNLLKMAEFVLKNNFFEYNGKVKK